MQRLAGQRVLIADGNSSIRAMLGRALKLSGALVEETGSGREALELLRDQGKKYGLAIADLRLPGIGGLEIRETLRRERPALSMLLLDSIGEGSDGPLNGHDCLSKPFTLGELRKHLSLCLSQWLAAS